MLATATPAPLSQLVSRAVHPGDEDWDSARQAFNLLVDQQPEAVVFPADEREVVDAVRHAREHGLRVAAQATGHNAGPLGSLEDTILLNTSGLTGFAMNAPARTVRTGAGTKWASVIGPLSQFGLAALHGSSPDVGVVGYSLGGGVGWLARKHGLQANSVTAVEMVTADGHLVRADAVHEPELFWALRGGGGNFGVVTAIEFGVLPVEHVYAGVMFFPFERAREVLHAWNALLPSLPDEITSWASLLQLPDLPEIPEPLRGGSFAIVSAAFLGTEAEGRDLLRPVRDLGPAMDTFAMVPPVGLAELAMDPPEPVPYMSGSQLLGPLPDAAMDDVAATAGPGSGSPLAVVQLRHTGGAMARPAAGAGARATLPGDVLMFAGGTPMDESSVARIRASLEGLTTALAPHQVGDYPNFVEEPTDASSFFDAETWARLREVKALYDPADLFKANHQIPPA